ncbi:MAG: hypothetical protein ACREMU_14480, partial [Gemmatimonadaceae bacterium]
MNAGLHAMPGYRWTDRATSAQSTTSAVAASVATAVMFALAVAAMTTAHTMHDEPAFRPLSVPTVIQLVPPVPPVPPVPRVAPPPVAVRTPPARGPVRQASPTVVTTAVSPLMQRVPARDVPTFPSEPGRVSAREGALVAPAGVVAYGHALSTAERDSIVTAKMQSWAALVALYPMTPDEANALRRQHAPGVDPSARGA